MSVTKSVTSALKYKAYAQLNRYAASKGMTRSAALALIVDNYFKACALSDALVMSQKTSTEVTSYGNASRMGLF